MPGLEQLTACRIDLKSDDVIRFLIGNQQEGPIWGNREVTGFPAIGGCVVLIGQPTGVFINKKADDAVMTTTGPIQIFSIG